MDTIAYLKKKRKEMQKETNDNAKMKCYGFAWQGSTIVDFLSDCIEELENER